MSTMDELLGHQRRLKKCRLCPDMIPPVVTCTPVLSPIMLFGQAPGDREGGLGRPFAWTAGKTLFKWFATIGLTEDEFRQRVYMAAVCRCFPGKNPKGGDRVPDRNEVEACSAWMHKEFELLKPELLIPVGKLAIEQFLEFDKLVDVIGSRHRITVLDKKTDLIPLPHPSGASTWHRMEPGKTLLGKALGLINEHKNWKKILNG